jgi:2-dehydropantoate 2-reductase
MHYIILGAGSIGCYVGGRLAANGQTVTFVGRQQTLDVLNQQGLTVSDLDGYHQHLSAGTLDLAPELRAEHLRAPAVILLCVKGTATSSTAQTLARLCPSGTPVISLQNGIDNVERIQSAAPQLTVLAGMVPFNVTTLKPGHFHRGTSGALCIEDKSCAAAVARDFERAGIPTVRSSAIIEVQWGKLLLNLNNPVNAVSNLPLKAQLRDRDYRCVVAALQTEALQVLRAAGIRPAKVASAPPWLIPIILRLPDRLFELAAQQMLQMDENARSSMWDDLQRGRTTEVDDLCGTVVRLAQRHGLQAPANAAMCTIIGGARSGQGIDGAELRRATGT